MARRTEPLADSRRVQPKGRRGFSKGKDDGFREEAAKALGSAKVVETMAGAPLAYFMVLGGLFGVLFLLKGLFSAW
ncbi:hypothetical protein [Variovorax sp. UC74_104]|uniref:hypothetical protein n=1 Tax=Variovorax sp. UC74_104 TaxID=3374555 RepID=UPI003756E69A